MNRMFLIVGLLAALAVFACPVHAAPRHALSASEIIATVNALRASRGLAPYTIDSGVMAYAQEHADYMARNDHGTHQHSDGSLPQDHGMTENVAGGTAGRMTADFVVFTIWADPVHMNTMIGYTAGSVGVGVASNGSNEYISLDVRPTGARIGSGSPATGSQTTAEPVVLIVPVVTATPRPDGSVVHVVGYGQSLWQIAITYGVKIDDIRGLNGLPAGSTTIYEGQKLVIFPAGSVTIPPSPTPTETPEAASPTPQPSATLRLPTSSPVTASRPEQTTAPEPTQAAAPTPVKSTPPAFLNNLKLDTTSILVGLVFGAAAVLFVVFLLSFRK